VSGVLSPALKEVAISHVPWLIYQFQVLSTCKSENSSTIMMFYQSDSKIICQHYSPENIRAVMLFISTNVRNKCPDSLLHNITIFCCRGTNLKHFDHNFVIRELKGLTFHIHIHVHKEELVAVFN